jgi:hypothetical protein
MRTAWKNYRLGASLEPVGEMQNQQAANGRRSTIVLELHSAFVIERRRKAPTWSERLRMPDCELAPTPGRFAK